MSTTDILTKKMEELKKTNKSEVPMQMVVPVKEKENKVIINFTVPEGWKDKLKTMAFLQKTTIKQLTMNALKEKYDL